MRPTLRALEGLEHLLLGSGHRTARRNAWTAVLEDRRRAHARTETERVLSAAHLATVRTAPAPPASSASPASPAPPAPPASAAPPAPSANQSPGAAQR